MEDSFACSPCAMLCGLAAKSCGSRTTQRRNALSGLLVRTTRRRVRLASRQTSLHSSPRLPFCVAIKSAHFTIVITFDKFWRLLAEIYVHEYNNTWSGSRSEKGALLAISPSRVLSWTPLTEVKNFRASTSSALTSTADRHLYPSPPSPLHSHGEVRAPGNHF